MLILGSQSKARYELLKIYNAEIEVRVADIDESFDSSLSVEENVQRVAYLKGQVLNQHLSKEDILICADTVCVKDGKVLTKVSSYQEAFDTLQSYSESDVQVITGVYMVFDGKEVNFSQTSDISFSYFSDEKIKEYLNDVDYYLNIAGALAIEVIEKYVDYTYAGSFSNIIGLPMEVITQLLFDRNILNHIDYSLEELLPIDYYRSSVRVFPIKDKQTYLLKCLTVDLKEEFYLSIGGGYHYFEDKTESLKKEAIEEAGMILDKIQPLCNVVEYNRNVRIMPYNKLSTHAYYLGEITGYTETHYVDYEKDLLLGCVAFDIKDALELLEKQVKVFEDKAYPIANISKCDLFALQQLSKKVGIKDE